MDKALPPQLRYVRGARRAGTVCMAGAFACLPLIWWHTWAVYLAGGLLFAARGLQSASHNMTRRWWYEQTGKEL
jgi:hypothetical protein